MIYTAESEESRIWARKESGMLRVNMSCNKKKEVRLAFRCQLPPSTEQVEGLLVSLPTLAKHDRRLQDRDSAFQDMVRAVIGCATRSITEEVRGCGGLLPRLARLPVAWC